MTLHVYVETLGCSKNTIDAEMMMGLLKHNQYSITDDIEKADIAIVNTCGFVVSAKEESIQRILTIAAHKKKQLKKLIVSGCLSERYHDELLEEIPEVDGFIGTGRFTEVVQVLEKVMKNSREISVGKLDASYPEELQRVRTTPKHMAYVKIAEGCDHRCTYCVIPSIRGPFRSRKPDAVLREIKSLAKEGVQEIILVAQDTTAYGMDLNKTVSLPLLLDQIEAIDEIRWVRLMYCYPERVTENLLDRMRNSTKICAYLDLPIQHSEDKILMRMNRKTTKAQLLSKIASIREAVPGIAIRTSIIVGFPGESDEDFHGLKEFVEEVKFDKLGVFSYSQEEDTPAALLPNQIDEDIKEKRLQELMQLQQEVSKRVLRRKIGCVCEVIIEECLLNEPQNHQYIGRTEQDAPEIDGVVYIHSNAELKVGSFVSVMITDAMEYDLIGVNTDETEFGK